MKRKNYRKYIKKRKKMIKIFTVSAAVLILLLCVSLLIYILNDAGGYLPNSDSSNSVSDDLGTLADGSTSDNTVVSESDNSPNEFLPEGINEIVCTTTSVSISFNNVSNCGYTVKYYAVTDENNHGKDYTEHDGLMMDDICCADYDFAFDRDNSDYSTETPQNGWYCVNTNDSYLTVEGLIPETIYEFHIYINDDEHTEYLPIQEINTYSAGFGDPFKNSQSILCLPQRDEETGVILDCVSANVVTCTSAQGCNNAVCKNVLEYNMYPVPGGTEDAVTVPVGTSLIVTADSDGNYCYRDAQGIWYLRVKSEELGEGWINAEVLMIDISGLFDSFNNIYGIQINRTNAYSSVFTAGGSAYTVDMESAPDTRYNPVSANNPDVIFTSTGYNIIEGITNETLPNYGSPSCMPVVWDLALELLNTQKHALKNGYSIVVYDGYRPVSTSNAVYGNLSASNALSFIPDGSTTNLAQGFLTDQSYNVSYYISNYSLHNMGIAADLSLIQFSSPDSLGSEVIMPTKMHTLDFRCNMQMNNWQADLLTCIMIGHGSNLAYLPNRNEWWHFQLQRNKTDIYPLANQFTYMDFVF